MYVDQQDHRPPTLLRFRGLSPIGLLVGILLSIGFHVGLITVLFVVGLAFGTNVLAREEPTEDDEEPEMQFVEARLVKLGREFDPRELPNRMREARTTAPRFDEVPRHRTKRVQPPDAGVVAADSVEDVLARLGTRADEMARVARAAEQEGDPDGVEEGTHTREEGDVYVSQLYAFFRRGFQMPSSIADADRRGLRAVARVQIGADGRVDGFNINSSGNADFDQAVRLRLDQATGARIPEPPEDRRDEFYGNTIPIAFVPPR
jgi:hypothetical protein